MKFIEELVNLGIDSLYAFQSAQKKVLKIKETLERLTIGNEEIDIEEFLEMYDTRIYNFDNKRNNIKIMKEHDFSGVYIIHNCTKNIFHVGKSEKVCRKINRQFEGYENQTLYYDYKNGDIFRVRIIKLENSNYDDISKLEKDTKEKYGEYIHKSNNTNQSKKTNNNTKSICMCIFLLITLLFFCVFMMIYTSN